MVGCNCETPLVAIILRRIKKFRRKAGRRVRRGSMAGQSGSDSGAITFRPDAVILLRQSHRDLAANNWTAQLREFHCSRNLRSSAFSAHDECKWTVTCLKMFKQRIRPQICVPE
jgi:hypothetical protein